MLRGLDLMLGVLLVLSSLTASAVLIDTSDHSPAPVEGQARFRSANYTGSATFQAEEAALAIRGPLSAGWSVDEATVHVYSYKRNGAYLGAGGYNLTVTYESGQDVETEIYEDATFNLEGKENGTLYAWPNSRQGGGSFEVALNPVTQAKIIASAHGATFEDPLDKHRYWLEGPVLGLGHEGAEYKQASAPAAQFDTVRASGAIVLFFDRGMLTIEDANGTTTVETGRESSGDDTASGVPMEERTYAVITVPTANLTFDEFQGLWSTFYSHEPVSHINGTLSFTGHDGTATTHNSTHPIDGDLVELTGNTTLTLEAHGENDGTQLSNGSWGLRPELLPQPEITGAFHGEAEGFALSGDRLPAPPQSTVVEDTSFWTGLLGLLLLGWAAAKKLIPFLLALFNGDPLSHPRRQRIHAYLEDAGVANVRELHRVTEIPLGSVVYHLKILKEAGLVASVPYANYKAYFILRPGLCREDMERLAPLAENTRWEIARHLVEEGPMTQADLVEALDMTQGAISRQIRSLVEAGLAIESGGQCLRYEPSSLLLDWVEG